VDFAGDSQHAAVVMKEGVHGRFDVVPGRPTDPLA